MMSWSAIFGACFASCLAIVPAALAEAKLKLQAPTMLVAEPGAETALLITITPAEAVPQSAFLRVRGVPMAVSLSEGHIVTQGVWAVPLFALPTLKLDVPTGVSGRSELQLTLVTANGQELAEARTAVVVANVAFRGKRDEPTRDASPVAAANRGGPTPTPPAIAVPGLAQGFAPPPATVSPQDPARDDRIFEGGKAALQAGRIAAARLYFERAARDGDARAALLLGETYDPAFLVRYGTRGPLPDIEAATLWYERAHSLGDAAAAERLARLASGGTAR